MAMVMAMAMALAMAMAMAMANVENLLLEVWLNVGQMLSDIESELPMDEEGEK